MKQLGGQRSGAGSSPLARGLRLVDGPKNPSAGIIPARAGFTQRTSRWRGASSDHPRSRGVYTIPRPGIGGGAGSSPLARGLLSITRAHRAAGGIIPARAGFTPPHVSRERSRGDHPRSRGVYHEWQLRRYPISGSSPLARGLRMRFDSPKTRSRIIPARAGFTSWSVNSLIPRTDHPRSRGVYHVRRRERTRSWGSSPLARGLLVAVRGVEAGVRIIPARAGFTRTPRRPCGPRKDHPRSRGVYAASASLSYPSTWIIPARAGFTAGSSVVDAFHGDHPRSRGVYRNFAARFPTKEGSSPLARGLLWTVDGTLARNRIIPARAGFTRRGGIMRRGPRDHPRSRGVYL